MNGPDAPATERSWYLLRIARSTDPRLYIDQEYFDPDSEAIRVTPREAARWLERHGIAPPDDLIALLDSGKNENQDQDGSEMQVPLTDDQREVWDSLNGAAYSAKELSKLVNGDPGEDSIRKRIDRIKKTGRAIKNKRGLGYFRPDAPPSEDQPDELTSG